MTSFLATIGHKARHDLYQTGFHNDDTGTGGKIDLSEFQVALPAGKILAQHTSRMFIIVAMSAQIFPV